MSRRSLFQLYAQEFRQYSSSDFFRDLFAGLTVAAVALPLALAFGVASGATAAAGLVTAILSGLLIGALSGAPYQISGPTGAMSAVLIVLAQRYGLQAVWVAGCISGLLLFIIGLLRLGRFIAFIPAPVITGFTSGIAVIIAVGQIDNLLGVTTPGAESAIVKIGNLFSHPVTPNIASVGLGLLVIGIMAFWPAKWALRFPSSLFGIIAATILSIAGGLDVAVIGEIPSTLLLPDRLQFSEIPWGNLDAFLVPVLSITALGAIESLLCGAVASNMTGVRLQANQELIAQGIGNFLIPFFGGVPATAAIARSSVGIRAGGKTRLVSIIHALALLLFMFAMAGVISKIPLSALAGVLIVTAWRMNEWHAIHFYFSRKLPSAIAKYLVTLAATVALDLTYAIAIGCAIAGAMFLNQASQLGVQVSKIDPERLRASETKVGSRIHDVRVAYLTGPLFFAATGHFVEAFADLTGVRVVILSMRGVPTIDTSGCAVIADLQERLKHQGGVLLFAGLHDQVRYNLVRAGVIAENGTERRDYWSSAEAIAVATA